uniref:Fibrinogen C-terminal domain-containing protein n=1 Tax=Ciona savignyi TaxID=51511 RepID=H2YQ78_CIOSA
SCKEAIQLGRIVSGIYYINNPRNQQTLEVYCDQTTDNGGWMVIQRRTDGSENFYRTWAEYQEKFGNLSNEFWLGLENLHALTRTGGYELRIELEDCANIRKFAKFSSFSIGSVEEQYSLTVSGYSGNAGKTMIISLIRDSLRYHNGRPFTTKDVDNDSRSGVVENNCAVVHNGAWWYGYCYHSNLNGAYLNCQTTTEQAASWGSFHGYQYSLKFIEMKFRPI